MSQPFTTCVGVSTSALFETVDLGSAVALELALHPGQALVDALPAGRDHVDKQREVVDSGVPLGQEVALEAFESANRLTRKASHLGELPSHRRGLGTHALPDGVLDASGKRRLDLRGELGQGLDLRPRPLQGGIDLAGPGAAFRGGLEALLRAYECSFVHGRER